MDQQKLTLDFIEKNFEEVVKKSSQENKGAKTVLPSVSTVHTKAKRLIEQRGKERQSKKELLKEKEPRTSARENEIPKLKSQTEENNKENRNSNARLSQRSSKRSDMEDRASHQG